MTNREHEIIKIIREDPLISQNDIAERLNITRSAVSVYLNAMYKKGILRGRGYLINDESAPVIIGPSHVDIRSVCKNSPLSEYHVSLKTQIAYGGPIKNVAEYLMCFGISPRAIFAVASDAFGNSFLDCCKQQGINSSGSIVVNHAATPVYIEMVDENRRLITSSFSSDNLTSHITPAHLVAQRSILKDANTIVVHDSLPCESIRCLETINPNADILLISSEIQYTSQQVSIFPVYHTAIMPFFIAFQIAHSSGDVTSSELVYAPSDLLPITRRLVELGLGNFYLMLDHFTLCYCDGTKLVTHTTLNPLSSSESLSAVYRDYRDIFAALQVYSAENGLPPLETMNLMASTRNLSRQSSTYFTRDLTLSRVKDNVASLLPTIKTIML